MCVCIQGVSKKMFRIQNRFYIVYLQNYGYQQQPTANKRTSGMHLSQFCFHMFNFVSRGEFRMLYFQVTCAQKFQMKNDIFCAARKYGMSLLICKNFRKIIRSKYRLASPEFPVFYILRCLKMHN